MMNFTPLARAILGKRAKKIARWQSPEQIKAVQLSELHRILCALSKTAQGRGKGLDGIAETDCYAALRAGWERPAEYADIRSAVMRMVDGEPDVLWPGVVKRFAQSSGTSDGKSKYIPITDESLRRCHYKGAAAAVGTYLMAYPDSRMFAGKGFILGGSFANDLNLLPDVKVGDLSATLIDRINPFANFVRVPSKETALMMDWRRKLPRLVEEASQCDITNISGVPSWFYTVLREVMKRRGAASIHEVWPNLEVFFHGGISMEPYRAQYASITAPGMRYWETYNASEGFFAVQSAPGERAMSLLLDTGIFYEFIPVEEVFSPAPQLLPAWEVEPGRVYALVITSCNGLTRYMLGDTVRIVSAAPLLVTVEGRTKCFINAFGEELMVDNAEKAMAKVCAEMRCEVADYTAAPVYAEGGKKGYHEWAIEFRTPPDDPGAFARALDDTLRGLNSDYDAKRTGDIFLDPLKVTPVSHGCFERWLASTGKLGGQRKVPRLANNRTIIDKLLTLNEI